jgi:hypothetical protein
VMSTRDISNSLRVEAAAAGLAAPAWKGLRIRGGHYHGH